MWLFQGNKGRNKNLCGICGQEMTDGANATELKIGWAEDVEVLLYVHRNRRFIKDGSPGCPPRLLHSSWSYQIWDMSFHDQVTMKCNGRVSDGVRAAFINSLHCTAVAVLSLFVKAVICFPSWSWSYDYMMYDQILWETTDCGFIIIIIILNTRIFILWKRQGYLSYGNDKDIYTMQTTDCDFIIITLNTRIFILWKRQTVI